MSHLIIRTTRPSHCKRGPQVCERCREMDSERICLLDIDPPDRGLVQRRVIEVEVGGARVWREFDILRAFADEAREFARTHGVEDVVL